MVADAPAFETVWSHIAEIAEGSVLACHNASFDVRVLCNCLAYYNLNIPECRYLCTVKVSQRVWPELENHKLGTVCRALGIQLNHHEAGSDARAAGLILQTALKYTHSNNAETLAEKIGMRLGRITSMGVTPCSIAKGVRGNT